MPQSMAVIALVSEPMWKRSERVILSGLPRVRTPATPRATVSPLRTTAAAMPGTSCFWIMGARIGETSLGGAAWMVAGVRQSRAKAIAETGGFMDKIISGDEISSPRGRGRVADIVEEDL